MRSRSGCALLVLLLATHAVLAEPEGEIDRLLAQNDDTAVITLPEDAASPKPAQRRTIEEIVVTAQKIEQGLRDVPISVSVLGGEMARDAAITNAQDLVQYTPNVKFTQALSAEPSIQIRGFGSPPRARTVEPSVGLSIDDVFYGRSTFTNDGVFDLKRLEVLRGPQGTLFGKNTVAGVLNFVTEEPSFEPEGFATLAFGSLDLRRAEAGLGFPLIENTLAARIAFRARATETGTINTTRGDEVERVDELAGRVKFTWEISDTLEARLMALTSHQTAKGTGFALQTALPGSLDVYREFDPRTEDEVYDKQVATDALSFNNRETSSVATKLVKSFARLGFIEGLDANLILNWASVKSPFQRDTDVTPIPWSTITTDGPEEYKQKTAEIRFTGTTPTPFELGTSMDWVTGLFYTENTFKVSQLVFLNTRYLHDFMRAGGLTGRPVPTPCAEFPGLPVCGPIPQSDRIETVANIVRAEGDSVSVFAQTTWQLTDRLSSVIGARLGKEDKSAFQSSQSTNTIISGLAGQQDFENAGARSETDFAPKFGLSFAITEGISVFGNATKGFKAGGFSGPLVAPVNTEFEPETAVSIELGAKTRLFDGTLALNATAFKLEFDNLQLYLFDGVNFSTVNAAEARATGFEVDFHWLPPLQFLTINGSVGYSDARYGDFPCGPARISDSNQNNPPECPQPSTPRSPAFQDLTGKTLPFAPKMTASLSPSVKLPLASRWGMGALLAIDLLYQGEHYLDADLDPHTFQPATTKLNARLGISSLSKDWLVMLNASNITGEKERLLVLDQPQMPGGFLAVPRYDEPVYMLDFRYNFGA